MRRVMDFVSMVAVGAVLGGTARAQFEMQDSTTTADLRGIVSVGNGTAWASGTRGTVLRTEDSGFVWQGCAMPPGAEKLDFRGIQAFDDLTAIVMSSGKGDLSRVYKTTDGCLTWKLVFTNPDADGFFDAIQMDGRKHGWVLGDPVRVQGEPRFAVFETVDGGQSWNAVFRVQPQLRAGTKEAVFAASNSSLVLAKQAVVVTGGSARALYIELTGAHAAGVSNPSTRGEWQVGYTPLPFASAPSGGAFSVAVHGRALVVVGGDYEKSNERNETAGFGPVGGRIAGAVTMPGGYRSAVAYSEGARTFVAVGPNGTDISVDDGRNWKPLRPAVGDAADANRNWNALSLPFVVGPHGRIGRLRDDVLSAAAAK